MKNNKLRQGNLYQIEVKEYLVQSSLNWFSDLTITPIKDNGTQLVGWFPDQPALRGLLDHLWNLNYTIQSLKQIQTGDQ